MAVIFFFSSQTGAKSGEVSNNVSSWIESQPPIQSGIGSGAGAGAGAGESAGTSGDVSAWVSGLTLLAKETVNFISDNIRKIAHVFLYACLALFVFFFFYTFPFSHRWLYFLLPFGFCFLYACSDEIHQLFVDGRNGTFLDVLIDGIGFLSVALLSNLIFVWLRKKGIPKNNR
jgi:VanZ family protein